jgi:histidyl-tRNA synthetase
MTLQSLPGFRDFFPEELALRSHVFAAMRGVARRYGFEEVDGPPLEALELYTDKSGDEIIGQLYAFEDKGGRSVALRPEMTPTIARMVAQRANGLKKPIRWFCIPQLFRYERQQRGRLREHFQLNCDILGEAGPLADAEIIALAIDVMRALGLGPTDVRVRVSDRRLLTVLAGEAGFDPGLHDAVFQALDKLGRSEYASRRRQLLERGASEAALAALEALPGIQAWADLEARFPLAAGAGEPLRRTITALDAMGLGEFLDLDLTIVRGLAYYTGTVFELFDAQRSLRAICGGGRYDDLLRRAGGPDMPALGFGMGDVVLSELLRERGLAPQPSASADVFVAAVTPDDRPFVLAMAHRLRDAGLAVEYAFGDDKVGRQLKLADARRTRYAVVLGPDERARSAAVLKDLHAGEQREVPLDSLASLLHSGLSAPATRPSGTRTSAHPSSHPDG